MSATSNRFLCDIRDAAVGGIWHRGSGESFSHRIWFLFMTFLRLHSRWLKTSFSAWSKETSQAGALDSDNFRSGALIFSKCNGYPDRDLTIARKVGAGSWRKCRGSQFWLRWRLPNLLKRMSNVYKGNYRPHWRYRLHNGWDLFKEWNRGSCSITARCH